MWRRLLCSARRPKSHGSCWWESFYLHLARGAVPPPGARPDVMNKCMSCLRNAGHATLPPGMNHLDSCPPSFLYLCTPLVKDPGLVSPPALQPINNPTALEEIDWYCVHRPSTNDVNAQSCHILLWPVRGRVPAKARECATALRDVSLKTCVPYPHSQDGVNPKSCYLVLCIHWWISGCRLSL